MFYIYIHIHTVYPNSIPSTPQLLSLWRQSSPSIHGIAALARAANGGQRPHGFQDGQHREQVIGHLPKCQSAGVMISYMTMT